MVKIISLIMAILFLASCFWFYSGRKNSQIVNFKRINFLFNSAQEVKLISISEDKIITIILPTEKKIRLTRGYGDYEIGKIYRLGEIDNKGSQLLQESVEDFLGIPIMAIVNESSGLSSFDTFYLRWRLIKVSKSNQKTIDLRQMSVFDQEGNFQTGKIDLFFEKFFEDEKVSKENFALAIFNCTDIAGLGNQAGRFVTNIGGRLISITNAASRQDCLIKSDKKIINSYTLKIIKKLFPCSWEEGTVENGRAEIGIFLGQDYWKKLSEKW